MSTSPMGELVEQQLLGLEYRCIHPIEIFVVLKLLLVLNFPMEELVVQLLLDY